MEPRDGGNVLADESFGRNPPVGLRHRAQESAFAHRNLAFGVIGEGRIRLMPDTVLPSPEPGKVPVRSSLIPSEIARSGV